MISTDDYHAQDVDDEEAGVDVIDFGKIVGSMKFKLKCKGTPKQHKPNLSEIESKTNFWRSLDDSVVNGYEWHKRHVPQEILGRHNFIKRHESPSLQYDSKKDVVVEGEASSNDHAPLGNEGKNGHNLAGIHIVHLVNHVKVHGIVVSVILSFKMIQIALIQKLIPIYFIEQACETQES